MPLKTSTIFFQSLTYKPISVCQKPGGSHGGRIMPDPRADNVRKGSAVAGGGGGAVGTAGIDRCITRYP